MIEMLLIAVGVVQLVASFFKDDPLDKSTFVICGCIYIVGALIISAIIKELRR
jgi:intracellular septation protein A